MSDKKFNVAVVGATGAVGNQMITCLEERKFPANTITDAYSTISQNPSPGHIPGGSKTQGILPHKLARAAE